MTSLDASTSLRIAADLIDRHALNVISVCVNGELSILLHETALPAGAIEVFASTWRAGPEERIEFRCLYGTIDGVNVSIVQYRPMPVEVAA